MKANLKNEVTRLRCTPTSMIDQRMSLQSAVGTTVNFNPGSWPTLPYDATNDNWAAEMEVVNHRPVVIEHSGEHNEIRNALNVRATVHIKSIGSKYGMPAPIPCRHCIVADEPCVIYHLSCYDWPQHGFHWKGLLGFSCMRCRALRVGGGATKSIVGGCDARWVAEPGEPDYLANSRFVERVGYY